jgi:hypothetical protein
MTAVGETSVLSQGLEDDNQRARRRRCWGRGRRESCCEKAVTLLPSPAPNTQLASLAPAALDASPKGPTPDQKTSGARPDGQITVPSRADASARQRRQAKRQASCGSNCLRRTWRQWLPTAPARCSAGCLVAAPARVDIAALRRLPNPAPALSLSSRLAVTLHIIKASPSTSSLSRARTRGAVSQQTACSSTRHAMLS